MRAKTKAFLSVVVLTLGCVGALVYSADPRASAYWFEDYEKTVRLIETGQHDDAIVLLRTVLKEQPSPIASLRVPGNQYIDYLPYFQRARIQAGQGAFEAASHSLDVSEAFGAVMQNRYTWNEFVKLREQINSVVGQSWLHDESTVATSVASGSLKP